MNLPMDPDKIEGGVNSAVFNLIPGFHEIEGLDLHILSFNRGISKNISKQLFNNISIHFEPYKIFGINKIDFVIKSTFFLGKYYRIIKPDIIHYQFHGFFLLMRIALLGREPEEVITFHGLTKKEALYTKKYSVKIINVLNEIINHIVLPANAIFISEYSQQQYSKYKFKKTAIVFNSVNRDFFLNDPKLSNENTLLYVGKISPLKNLHLLLSAIKRLKDENIEFNLHVIGSFNNEVYKNIIMDYIGSNDLNSLVTFHGLKSQHEILGFLRKADALVVPSQHENLPIVITEAMASGRVVIASIVGGIPEMIENKVTGYLFKPGNKQELCSILKEYLNTNTTILSQKAKNYALLNFCPTTNAKKIYNFYIKLLTKPL